MAISGPEVADAYIQVHADTTPFGRELRQKMATSGRLVAQDFGALLRKGTRADLKRFQQDLADATRSGDWSGLHRKLGTTRKLTEAVSVELERMAKRGFITTDQAKAVNESLQDYVDGYQKLLKVREADAKYEIERLGRADTLNRILADQTKLEGRAAAERENALDRLTKLQIERAAREKDWAFLIDGSTEAAKRHADLRERTLRNMARMEIERAVRERDYKFLVDETSAAAILTPNLREAALKRMYVSARDDEIDMRRAIEETGLVHRRVIRDVDRDYRGLFGRLRGARNDFVNALGIVLGSVETFTARSVNFASRGIGTLTMRLGEMLEGVGGGNNAISVLGTGLRGLGTRALAAGGGLASVVTTVAAAIAALGTLGLTLGVVVSAISTALGVIYALAASLGSALLAVVPAAAAFTAFGGAIGLAVVALLDMDRYTPRAKRALEDLKRTFQEVNLGQFAKEWDDSLANFFDTVEEALGDSGFGGALGRAMAQVTDSFSSALEGPGFRAFVEAMETRLPNAMASFGAGFASLGEGILSLIAGASPAAERLGSEFAAWADRFAAKMEELRQNGTLNEIFDSGVTSLGEWVRLLESVGGLLVAVFRTGSAEGDLLLSKIRGIIDSWTAWLNDPNNQAKIDSWLTKAQETAGKLWEALVDVGDALADFDTDQARADLESLISVIGDIKVALDIVSASTALMRLNFALLYTIVAGSFTVLGGIVGQVGYSILAIIDALSWGHSPQWVYDAQDAMLRLRDGSFEAFKGVGDTAAAIGNLDGLTATANVRVTGDAEAKSKAIQERLGVIDNTAPISIISARDLASLPAEQVQKKLDQLAASNPSPLVTVQDQAAAASARAFQGQLDRLAATNPNSRLQATDLASKTAASVQGRLDFLARTNPTSTLTAKDNASGTISNILGGLGRFVSKTITLTAKYISLGSFAEGGYVPAIRRMAGGPVYGEGSSTSDSIPAMLSNGEYVIQASAVSHYGRALFDLLNARQLGGEAGGAERARGLYIAPGAIQVVTPAADPQLVARMVIDDLVSITNLGA